MDDLTDRFLRILVELAAAHCLSSEAAARPADHPLSFIATDALVKLVVCLVVAHGGGETVLSRVLLVMLQVRQCADV